MTIQKIYEQWSGAGKGFELYRVQYPYGSEVFRIVEHDTLAAVAECSDELKARQELEDLANDYAGFQAKLEELNE